MSEHDMTHDDDLYDEPEVVYTTHPKVVAGVVLLASLALFSVASGLAFLILDGMADTDSSRSSAMIALVVGAVVAALFWVFVPDDAA